MKVSIPTGWYCVEVRAFTATRSASVSSSRPYPVSVAMETSCAPIMMLLAAEAAAPPPAAPAMTVASRPQSCAEFSFFCFLTSCSTWWNATCEHSWARTAASSWSLAESISPLVT